MANNQSHGQSSGGVGGIGDKLSSAVGAGSGSGEDQSYLSKGIEAVQQSVMGQSGTKSGQETQSGTNQAPHEAAVDRMHPEQVSEFMREKYKSTTTEQDRKDMESKLG